MAQVRAAVAALEAGAVEQQILTYRRRFRGEEWIWQQVHAGISARDADGAPTALGGVSFDVTAEMTARAQAQEEQAHLREELQRAQQRHTVAQVAGGVAHDLNNLIAVVAGTVEMLEMQAAGHAGLLNGLERIRRSVDMARDLIAGLGGLTHAELPREAQDLGKLLRNAVDLLGQRRIERNGVRVELSEARSPVWANPTEFAQVVVNLAINACDSGRARPTGNCERYTPCRLGPPPPPRAPRCRLPTVRRGAHGVFHHQRHRHRRLGRGACTDVLGQFQHQGQGGHRAGVADRLYHPADQPRGALGGQ